MDLPGYEALRLIGSGGSAQVWEGLQSATGQRVAIKIVKSDVDAELAQAEISALAKINDQSSAVRILDALDLDVGRVIVLEFIDGPTAGDRAREYPFEATNALDVIIAIGSVVQVLHERGYVHGDIKPDNILLSNAGPKLLDFGLARPIGPDGLTEPARGFTLLWSPPELLEGHGRPSARSEVYSLALTLLTLLTGELPQWGPIGEHGTVTHHGTNADVLRGVYAGFDRSLLPRLTSRLDERVLRIIGRASAIDPAMRHSTVLEFIEELRALRLEFESREPMRLREVESPPRLPWTAGTRLIHSVPNRVKLINAAAIEGAPDFAPVAAQFDEYVQARAEDEAGPTGAASQQGGPRDAPLILAVVTALALEHAAVVRHLKNRRRIVGAQGISYVFGTFGGVGREWIVASTCVGPGNLPTALVAQQTSIWLRPDLIGFVGIAGGLKDVAVGDVVVASKVVGYESAKVGDQLMPRADVRNVTAPLVQHFTAIGSARKWRSRLPLKRRSSDYQVLVKPIAAGEKVLANSRSATVKAIRKYFSDVVAVEMEGLGLLAAADYSPDVSAVVVRGISDLLDEKSAATDADRQPLAADTASAVFFEGVASLDAKQLRFWSPRDDSAQEVIDMMTIHVRGERNSA